MPAYWVIAPYEYDRKHPESWEKVWKDNLANGFISMGFTKLGDVSTLNEKQVRDAIDRVYESKQKGARANIYRMVHGFYHEVKPGDVVIARQGLKKLAGVGIVSRAAYYDRNKNQHAKGDHGSYSNHLDVQWNAEPQGKSFNAQVFGMQTMYSIAEEKFRQLLQGDGRAETPQVAVIESQITRLAPASEEVQDPADFVLEKYLEDFIVSNLDVIFKGKLKLYSDPDAGVDGQQYETDIGIIDVLAQDKASGDFVVLELKKGRESDKVVGQVLRYMGWVSKNLCQDGQGIKGIVVCKEPDERLVYALQMTRNVEVKYYRIDFKLQDQP